MIRRVVGAVVVDRGNSAWDTAAAPGGAAAGDAGDVGDHCAVVGRQLFEYSLSRHKLRIVDTLK